MEIENDCICYVFRTFGGQKVQTGVFIYLHVRPVFFECLWKTHLPRSCVSAQGMRFLHSADLVEMTTWMSWKYTGRTVPVVDSINPLSCNTNLHGCYIGVNTLIQRSGYCIIQKPGKKGTERNEKTGS